MRLPGVEPGSFAWKANMITVTLQTRCQNRLYIVFTIYNLRPLYLASIINILCFLHRVNLQAQRFRVHTKKEYPYRSLPTPEFQSRDPNQCNSVCSLVFSFLSHCLDSKSPNSYRQSPPISISLLHHPILALKIMTPIPSIKCSHHIHQPNTSKFAT